MATSKCVLLPERKKDKTSATVYLRIIKERKPKYVSLDLRVNPKFWDKTHGKVKPSHPNSARINKFLHKKLEEAEGVIIDMETDSKYVPVKTLKQAVLGLSGVDFFPYAEKFVKKYKAQGKIGTFNRFNTVLEKMKYFIGKNPFTFDHLDIHFLKQFEAYLVSHYENKTNTIHANLKAIMRIVNEAVNDEVITIERNPFLKYKVKLKPTEKIFLTEEEITAMENLALEEGSMKYHHRNMYILACYAGGIRISDLITLRWSNYDGEHILLNTKKTGSVVSIKVPEKAKEILQLYHNEDTKKEDFVFPFIDNPKILKDPQKLHTLISSVTAYTNTDLKDLAKDAKIGKHIHFHTSRHTWATRALKKGMRIEYVSKLMGHTSIKTTQVYAKIVNADLDKAMEVFDVKAPEVQPEEEKK